jgi:hypothetical protein
MYIVGAFFIRSCTNSRYDKNILEIGAKGREIESRQGSVWYFIKKLNIFIIIIFY